MNNKDIVQMGKVTRLSKNDPEHFIKLQEMIYVQLPGLINGIYAEALLNCEQGSTFFRQEDMKFIACFIEETKRIFDISMKKNEEMTREILKMPLKKKAESKDCNRDKTNDIEKISKEISDRIRSECENDFTRDFLIGWIAGME